MSPETRNETVVKITLIVGTLLFAFACSRYFRKPSPPPKKTTTFKNNQFPTPRKNATSFTPILKLREKRVDSPWPSSAKNSTPREMVINRFRELQNRQATPLSKSQVTQTSTYTFDEEQDRLVLKGYFSMLERVQENDLAKVLALRKKIIPNQDVFTIYKKNVGDLPEKVSRLEQTEIKQTPSQFHYQSDNASISLGWYEVFFALGYFQNLLTLDKNTLSATLKNQPYFGYRPILTFFMENITDMGLENEWNDLFYTTFVTAYTTVHRKIVQNDLFAIAYPEIQLLNIELFTPPSSPTNSPVKISISPIEQAASEWIKNPVVHWILYRLLYGNDDLGPFAPSIEDEVLCNFKKIILYLFATASYDENANDEALGTLKKEAQTYLAQLSKTLKKFENIKKTASEISKEDRSNLFESYLFSHVLKNIESKFLTELDPEWEQVSRKALKVLKENGIQLIPEWDL